MSNFRRLARQTLTIARRDFIATVFTPTFLIFLLAPVIMGAFGAIGGTAAAGMAGSGEGKMRIVVIAPTEHAEALVATDRVLRKVFPTRSDDRPPVLRVDSPTAEPAQQARALFDNRDVEVSAILYGPLERPDILYAPRGRAAATYLAQLAEQTLRSERAHVTGPVSRATVTPIQRTEASYSARGQVAFMGVFGLFFLTLILAGQPVGTMAEERSNKVVEILAAAVPLEAVFLGKLIGMFGSAVLFLGFWGTILANLPKLLPVGIAAAFSDLGPAVGGPTFLILFLAYFTMLYMLLGSIFLSVGAQASTPREIQMLVFPITIFQMIMFGTSSYAAAHPGTWIAKAAEIFPFSSPFAMVAHAANFPEVWPHLLAILWQLLWVAITIYVGAAAFRRGVLKSGSPKLSLKAVFGR